MNIISFEITLETTNAAFDGNSETEVARILREVADMLEVGMNNEFIRDINGNKIGHFYAELNDDEPELDDD